MKQTKCMTDMYSFTYTKNKQTNPNTNRYTHMHPRSALPSGLNGTILSRGWLSDSLLQVNSYLAVCTYKHTHTHTLKLNGFAPNASMGGDVGWGDDSYLFALGVWAWPWRMTSLSGGGYLTFCLTWTIWTLTMFTQPCGKRKTHQWMLLPSLSVLWSHFEIGCCSLMVYLFT